MQAGRSADTGAAEGRGRAGRPMIRVRGRGSRQVERALGRVRAGRRRRQYWAPVVTAVLFCFVFFHLVLGVWVVSGDSMAPSLLPGDVVLGFRIGPVPKHGDLAVIREPSGVEMVKRVAGRAGDTLDIMPDGHVIRNGQLVSESSVWYGGQDTGQWIGFPLIVPDGTVFCLGDNRPLSLDSRHRAIGPVPASEVAGRIFFVLRLP